MGVKLQVHDNAIPVADRENSHLGPPTKNRAIHGMIGLKGMLR